MTFIIAKKQGHFGLLLIVTDKDILGKKYLEGRKQLDLSKEFYQGEEMSLAEVELLFEQARHLHLTGKEAVALVVMKGWIEAKRILYVQGVPHIQVVMG